MPIEITELIVRARVGNMNESPSSSVPSSAPSTSADPGASQEVRLLEKAVEEALNLIKRKNER